MTSPQRDTDAVSSGDGWEALRKPGTRGIALVDVKAP
ncbi:MAG: hypothetical protein RL033_2819, partial [Pseudomonadota bacterium]